MKPLSVDLKDMLIEESSLALVFGTNLHIGREPDGPNMAVTIFDTSGAPVVSTLDRVHKESPTAQIRVRSTDYETGWEKIEAIKEALIGRANETRGATLYLLITIMSGPAFLRWDDKNRACFILNIQTQRRIKNGQ